MNMEGEMAKTRGKSVTGTEKKAENLKPFKPGQSGNPKGRPKGAAIAWAQGSFRL